MIPVKLILVLKTFLELQPIIVNSRLTETQLYPAYKFPYEELPPPQPGKTARQMIPCIDSLKYVINGNEAYLGIQLDGGEEFLYVELNSNFAGNDSCPLDSSLYLTRKDVSFHYEEQLMFLAFGCFIVDGSRFEGLLILMNKDWTEDFLKTGFDFFGFSQTHKYDPGNSLLNQSPNLFHCSAHQCDNFKKIVDKECHSILDSIVEVHKYGEMEEVTFFIVFLVFLIVAGISLYLFWYRSE